MKFEEHNWETLYSYAKGLAERRFSYNDIERMLQEKEADASLINEIVRQLRKTQYAIQRKAGLQKIVFGSILLVIGFLITCVNFHSNQSFTVVMYSFTSISLCLIFWGLYNILG